MKPLVSFVIITRDRCDAVMRALESVRRQGWPAREMILVDNASTDSTAAAAAALPDVTVVPLPRNLGVAGGRNAGIRRSHGDILVFLDDDAEFDAVDAAEGIVRAFETYPTLGALALRVVDFRTREVIAREFPGRDLALVDTEFETSYFIGAGFALRRAALEETGLFDALYVYAMEEVDLGVRLVEAGWSVRYDPTIQVLHRRSAAARPPGQWYHFNMRARFILTVKYLPVHVLLPHLLIWTLFIGWRGLVAGHLWHFLTGFQAGLRLVPALLGKRRPLTRETLTRLQAMHGRVWW